MHNYTLWIYYSIRRDFSNKNKSKQKIITTKTNTRPISILRYVIELSHDRFQWDAFPLSHIAKNCNIIILKLRNLQNHLSQCLFYVSLIKNSSLICVYLFWAIKNLDTISLKQKLTRKYRQIYGQRFHLFSNSA